MLAIHSAAVVKATLRQHLTEKWQLSWDHGQTARELHTIIATVSLKPKNHQLTRPAEIELNRLWSGFSRPSVPSWTSSWITSLCMWTSHRRYQTLPTGMHLIWGTMWGNDQLDRTIIRMEWHSTGTTRNWHPNTSWRKSQLTNQASHNILEAVGFFLQSVCVFLWPLFFADNLVKFECRDLSRHNVPSNSTILHMPTWAFHHYGSPMFCQWSFLMLTLLTAACKPLLGCL